MTGSLAIREFIRVSGYPAFEQLFVLPLDDLAGIGLQSQTAISNLSRASYSISSVRLGAAACRPNPHCRSILTTISLAAPWVALISANGARRADRFAGRAAGGIEA